MVAVDHFMEMNERGFYSARQDAMKALGMSHISYPYETEIVYECPHDVPRKYDHHFDYTDRKRVHRLCGKCHGEAHSRIRKENMVILTTAIAVAMMIRRRQSDHQ